MVLLCAYKFVATLADLSFISPIDVNQTVFLYFSCLISALLFA